MKKLIFLIFGCVVFVAAARADGEHVFNENFDDAPPYKPKGEVPVGYDIIRHGEWAKPGSGYRPAYVKGEIFLSEPYSLSVQATPSFEKGSRVLGFFGRTNKEGAPISQGLSLRLAFQVSNVLDGLSFGIRNAEHKNAALVEMAGEGMLNASFSGVRKELASVEVGKWYYLEFRMPPDAGSKSKYTVTLYAEDGATELASLTGELAQAAGAGALAYFHVGHSTQGESVYLDNITAVENPWSR